MCWYYGKSNPPREGKETNERKLLYCKGYFNMDLKHTKKYVMRSKILKRWANFTKRRNVEEAYFIDCRTWLPFKIWTFANLHAMQSLRRQGRYLIELSSDRTLFITLYIHYPYNCLLYTHDRVLHSANEVTSTQRRTVCYRFLSLKAPVVLMNTLSWS